MAWWQIAVALLIGAAVLTFWLEQRRRAAFEASLKPDELAGYRGFLATNHVIPGRYGWRDAAEQIRRERTAASRSA